MDVIETEHVFLKVDTVINNDWVGLVKCYEEQRLVE